MLQARGIAAALVLCIPVHILNPVYIYPTNPNNFEALRPLSALLTDIRYNNNREPKARRGSLSQPRRILNPRRLTERGLTLTLTLAAWLREA